MPPPTNERFWASTRGRIVVMLRAGGRTVGDLAGAVGLTDNAVRAHLTALERDGLVRQTGSRRGTRKPNLTYGLTPAAEHLFPRDYAPVLVHLLDVLKERTSADALDEVVRAVGHRMAPAYRAVAQAAGPADRPGQALAVLRDMGGFCDKEVRAGGVLLSCGDCPLAAAVEAHPEVCKIVETVLADVLGGPVRERCQPPRCAFEVTGAAE